MKPKINMITIRREVSAQSSGMYQTTRVYFHRGDMFSIYQTNPIRIRDGRVSIASILRAKRAQLTILARARANQTPRAPEEVKPVELSPETLALAHAYMAVVEQYDNPTSYREAGYTPVQMELRRTLAHDKLIAALQRERVVVSDRAATTELARRIETWLRE